MSTKSPQTEKTSLWFESANFKECHNGDVHYIKGGRGSPIIMLNGWSASAYVWPSLFVECMADAYEVICISNRGTLPNKASCRSLTIAQMARDVFSVMDQENIDRAVVFGFSLGGRIVQEMTMQHPERIEAQIICSSSAPRPAAEGSAENVVDSLISTLSGAEGMEAVGAVWERLAAKNTLSKVILQDIVQSTEHALSPQEGIRAQFQAIQRFSGAARLSKIKTPTLVLHGLEDKFQAPENGRVIASLIPDAKFEGVSGAGHLLPWERPDYILLKIKDFVSENRCFLNSDTGRTYTSGINRAGTLMRPWGDGGKAWILQGGADLQVLEESMMPHTSEEKHYHEHAHQFFYVLSGELQMEFEEQTVLMRAGEGCDVPPGSVHQAVNNSDSIVVFLVVASPTTIGDRIGA